MENVNPITPATIEGRKFRIPLYQRLFEWDEVQLICLLNDMKEHFIKCESSESGVRPYYIGMMTGCKSSDNTTDLVDGQQRFTTMVLLGIVMGKVYCRWKDFSCIGRLKFTARDEDEKYLCYLIDNYIHHQYREIYNCYDDNCAIKLNMKMERALIIIEQFLDNMNETQRKDYCKNVYEQMTFFISYLPDSYNSSPNKLNKYFEAMNSAGRSLEQYEKVKVDLLRKCPDGYEKSLFNSIWNEVERMEVRLMCSYDHSAELGVIDAEIDRVCNTLENDWNIKTSDLNERCITIENIIPSSDEPISQRRRKEIGSVVDFQELLILTLNFTLGTEHALDKYKLEHLFHDFPEDKIPDFYRNLYKIRLLIDRYVIRIEKDSGRNVYRMKFSDDEQLSDSERRVIQYQSMLYVSTSARLWLTPYLKWLMFSKNRKSANADVLLCKLKEIDNEIHGKLPELGDMFYPGIDLYWFWRLDYYLWERRDFYFSDRDQLEIVAKYVFKSNRSKEHLHPQNQSKNVEWEAEDVNSFGNLALISSSFNSVQSNDPVLVKFARIENQVRNGDLESIKMYRMYLDAKQNPDLWTLETKNKHQQAMYELLSSSYNKKI